jgi:hypothetical protein
MTSLDMDREPSAEWGAIDGRVRTMRDPRGPIAAGPSGLPRLGPKPGELIDRMPKLRILLPAFGQETAAARREAARLRLPNAKLQRRLVELESRFEIAHHLTKPRCVCALRVRRQGRPLAGTNGAHRHVQSNRRRFCTPAGVAAGRRRADQRAIVSRPGSIDEQPFANDEDTLG